MEHDNQSKGRSRRDGRQTTATSSGQVHEHVHDARDPHHENDVTAFGIQRHAHVLFDLRNIMVQSNEDFDIFQNLRREDTKDARAS